MANPTRGHELRWLAKKASATTSAYASHVSTTNHCSVGFNTETQRHRGTKGLKLGLCPRPLGTFFVRHPRVEFLPIASDTLHLLHQALQLCAEAGGLGFVPMHDGIFKTLDFLNYPTVASTGSVGAQYVRRVDTIQPLSTLLLAV